MSAPRQFTINREPDDPLALRLSIGQPLDPAMSHAAYIVHRGDPADCLTLLRAAVRALEGALAVPQEGPPR